MTETEEADLQQRCNTWAQILGLASWEEFGTAEDRRRIEQMLTQPAVVEAMRKVIASMDRTE